MNPLCLPYRSPATLRLVALGVVELLSRAFDWLSLREATGRLAVWMLEMKGHAAALRASLDQVIITDRLCSYSITEKCCYVDLILMLVIMVWRRGISMRGNLVLAVALTLSIYFLNAARIALVVDWTAGGSNWYWAHDLPDSVLYWSAFGLGSLWFLHREFRSQTHCP